MNKETKNIAVKRTGRVKGIASSEFEITFPDGTKSAIWSPIWHDWDKQTESEQAYLQALKMWERG